MCDLFGGHFEVSLGGHYHTFLVEAFLVAEYKFGMVWERLHRGSTVLGDHIYLKVKFIRRLTFLNFYRFSGSSL